ncbi:MAG TPA: HepT-like ribonuclease domain-containing protein [Chthoniobacterales bacterium]|jgi:uncharacterized protein with HEPN domain
MSNFDPRVTLTQIQEFIEELGVYIEGETLASLLTDPMRMRAFERVMQCIGEAVKRLPMSLREAYPAVDWKGAAGLRDWVAHGYDGVDHEILWKAAHEQLPGLKQTTEQMLADLG